MASYVKFKFFFLGAIIAAVLLLPGEFARGSEPVVLEVKEPVSVSPSKSFAVVLQGAWGKEAGQFGKVDEASRPGPMDFAVVGDELFVLDSVNSRVQVFTLDGGFRKAIPIATATADFMAVDDQGNITVLDAFVKRECKTFQGDGTLKKLTKIPAELKLPSAIFVAGDSIWVEERHSQVFEISDSPEKNGSSGKITKRISGRPVVRAGKSTGEFSTVHARRNGQREVILRVSDDLNKEKLTSLRFPRVIGSVVGLDTDVKGRCYLTAACLTDEKNNSWNTDLVTAVFSPEGEIVKTVCMPNNYITDHYRKVFVTPAGDIYQMQTDSAGVRFIRWESGNAAGRGEK